MTACLLLGCSLLCAAWLAVARKPWHTLALAADVPVKQTPRDDFIAAGVWIGLLGSAVIALVLAATCRWWCGPAAAPMDVSWRPRPRDRDRWFWFVLTLLVGGALWQCWPAMTHSFWGDETLMFTESVHGQWRAAVKGGAPQESLRFREVPWKHAFFMDNYGANHWLATHMQRLALRFWQFATQRPAWCFEEWVVRLVSLGAGLAAIAAEAMWLRWLGRPLTGLVGAGFLALHPSVLRFCVEARGYSLMLLFLILTLWSFGCALRHGRRRDWLMVAVFQFLTLYSWKGAVYGLAFLNAAVGVRLTWGAAVAAGARRSAVARWLAAGLLGAMVFLPLAMPSELQIRKSIGETRKRAKPMDAVWRDNLISETLTGIPWHEREPDSPREVSVQRLMRESKWTVAALAVCAGVLAAGMWRLWRQDRWLAWFCVALAASGVAAAAHFKYVLQVELLTWYLVYLLPVLGLVFAAAVTPGRRTNGRAAVGAASGMDRTARPLAWVALVAVSLGHFAFLARPKVAEWRRWAREDFKTAVRMTRGAHESPGFSGASNVYTGWLWRFAAMYDPRGDNKVRTLEVLEEKCRLARERDGEFYMIVGMRELSEAVFPDLMGVLRDPDRFEHLATLWGGEPIHTLDVYRLRR